MTRRKTLTGLITVLPIIVILAVCNWCTARCEAAESTPHTGDDSPQPEKGHDWRSPVTGMEFAWIEELDCWVGKYEVTNAEYRQKEPGHVSESFKEYALDGERQPVVGISHTEARSYATWLTKKERATGALSERLRYVLPTGEQWVTFAQAGSRRVYPWGDHWPPPSGQAGNYAGEETQSALNTGRLIDGYRDGYAVPCSVDDCWKNEWGLYGVGGNVWECTSRTPGGAFDGWRGGSATNGKRVVLRCRYAKRVTFSEPYNSFGFRLVLSSFRKVQADSEAVRPPDPTRNNLLDMEFVRVAPGSFRMGSDSAEAEDCEQPIHQVRITRPFWIGRYEVTLAEYRRFMKSTGATKYTDWNKEYCPYKYQREKGYPLADNVYGHAETQPVVEISWNGAEAFCKWLTKVEKRAGRLPYRYEYRLPTEAEWEYAARGGRKSGRTFKYSGSNDIDEVAWYKSNTDDRPHRVGRKKPNELGIYDMSGNVCEFCLDSFVARYYEVSPSQDPVHPAETYAAERVARGGSKYHPPKDCRVTTRLQYDPRHTYTNVGFRIVLAPKVKR